MRGLEKFKGTNETEIVRTSFISRYLKNIREGNEVKVTARVRCGNQYVMYGMEM